jgi:hypothetical protein
MFLICNGLLVFVGITRSLSWSSSVDESSNYVKESMLVVKTNEPNNNEENIEDEYTMEIKYSSVKAEESVEEGKGSSILVLDQEEGLEEESGLFGERNEEEDKESKIVERVEDEEVLEEASLVLSTEELNKKFDDFIKKMKKDLRIEAQK